MELLKSSSNGGVAKPFSSPALTGESLQFTRYFSHKEGHPFDSVGWKKVDAVLKSADGKIVFELKDVEAPDTWSQRAINIVAEKYFRVIDGKKETSVKQLITRVARTIAHAGQDQGLFNAETSVTFEMELCYLLVHQMFAFNSPVWFNIGVPGVPQQASACFINSVEDTMESITNLAKTEVMLFKGGSGAGSNLSKIRSSHETLSGGGTPSGPVSFMKMLDAGAGVTKSGGTTRRAALMRVLDVDHPDILEQANGESGFINCKTNAEKIAQALIAAGFSKEFNKAGNAYDLTPFQNANNSVRVTDYFMNKVADNQVYKTTARLTGLPVHTYQARDVWNAIATAAWASGDPGIQFDTTTNAWHTLPNTGRVNGSNPCSEYVHLDDTSCNLGSFNLLKFLSPNGEFMAADFSHAVTVAITGMEILVGYASYPTPQITKQTQASRPLGVGYANLGTLLMVLGMPYDSKEGRDFAAAITSLMTSTAYAQSAAMAQKQGPFEYYAANQKEMMAVIRKHAAASVKLPDTHTSRLARDKWNEAIQKGGYCGFRNSQTSVLAPTGTIGFMMDCDTTGVEPNLALTQYKKLVGGGFVQIPTRAVEQALRFMGYRSKDGATAFLDVEDILTCIEKTGELPVDMPKEHKKVFQTAIGADAISTEGHLLMMAAVQPFLSGGISKTVNMASTVTVVDVANVYMRAWELGLKCVAIYRDGCKASQPTSAKKEKEKEVVSTQEAQPEGPPQLKWGERKRLLDERISITHKLSIAGQDAYFHLGLNPDGSPGELFINISKVGSSLSGLVDMAATAISVGLQHGVPMSTFIDKFKGSRFEPAGFTSNLTIPRTSSIADYLARWLEQRTSSAQEASPVVEEHLAAASAKTSAAETSIVVKKEGTSYHGDPCRSCGNITVRAGSCWVCTTCATTTGCG